MSYCDRLSAYRARYGLRKTAESFIGHLRSYVALYNDGRQPELKLEICAKHDRLGDVESVHQLGQVLEISPRDFGEYMRTHVNTFTDMFYDPVAARFHYGEMWFGFSETQPSIKWTLHTYDSFASVLQSCRGIQLVGIDRLIESLPTWTAVCARHVVKISLECDLILAGMRESLDEYILPELLSIVCEYVAPLAVRTTSFTTNKS